MGQTGVPNNSLSAYSLIVQVLMVTVFLFTRTRNGRSLIVETKPIELVVLEGCIRLGNKPIEGIVLGAQVN